jgi:DMSO/TMAO reductase YedYZ heme-binding membrane subunit
VAFGILAMDAGLVVLVSSWSRRHLSNTTWRALHLLAVPAFALSMLHGISAGTDTVRPWMWWTYVVTGGIVLFLVIARGLTAGIRPARDRRHAGPAPSTSRVQRVPVSRPERPVLREPVSSGSP